MDANYESMTRPELESLLSELLDNLDDVEILRDSVLGQTGNHVSSGYVKKFAREIAALNDKIQQIQTLLAKS